MVHKHIRDISRNACSCCTGAGLTTINGFNVSGLKRAMRRVNLKLITWVINKYDGIGENHEN